MTITTPISSSSPSWADASRMGEGSYGDSNASRFLADLQTAFLKQNSSPIESISWAEETAHLEVRYEPLSVQATVIKSLSSDPVTPPPSRNQKKSYKNVRSQRRAAKHRRCQALISQDPTPTPEVSYNSQAGFTLDYEGEQIFISDPSDYYVSEPSSDFSCSDISDDEDLQAQQRRYLMALDYPYDDMEVEDGYSVFSDEEPSYQSQIQPVPLRTPATQVMLDAFTLHARTHRSYDIVLRDILEWARDHDRANYDIIMRQDGRVQRAIVREFARMNGIQLSRVPVFPENFQERLTVYLMDMPQPNTFYIRFSYISAFLWNELFGSPEYNSQSSIGDQLAKLRALGGIFHNTSPETIEDIKRLTEPSSSTLTSKIKDAIMTALREMLEPLTEALKGFVATIVLLTIYIKEGISTLFVTVSIALGGYAAYHNCDFMSRILRRFSEAVDGFMSQSGECMDVASFFCSTVCLVLGVKFRKDWFSTIVIFFSSFSRMSEGFSVYMEKLIEGTKMVYNIIADKLGWTKLEVAAIVIPDAELWIRQVQDMDRAETEGRLKFDIETGQTVSALYHRGIALIERLRANPETRALCATLMTYHGVVSRMKTTFTNASVYPGESRPEPVVLCIRGATAVGKSSMTKSLIFHIWAKVVGKEMAASFVQYPDSIYFARAAECKYWDGYMYQPFLLMDDFGQVKDIAGDGDNEYMNMIRAANIFDFQLHMADISRKANTRFCSEFIIVTTNLAKFSPVSLMNGEALERRMDIDISVAPKEEYAKYVDKEPHDFAHRRLDISKLKAENCLDLSIYEFKDTRSDCIYTWDELIQQVLVVRSRKAAYSASSCEVQQNIITRTLQERFPDGYECQGSMVSVVTAGYHTVQIPGTVLAIARTNWAFSKALERGYFLESELGKVINAWAYFLEMDVEQKRHYNLVRSWFAANREQLDPDFPKDRWNSFIHVYLPYFADRLWHYDIQELPTVGRLICVGMTRLMLYELEGDESDDLRSFACEASARSKHVTQRAFHNLFSKMGVRGTLARYLFSKETAVLVFLTMAAGWVLGRRSPPVAPVVTAPVATEEYNVQYGSPFMDFFSRIMREHLVYVTANGAPIGFGLAYCRRKVIVPNHFITNITSFNKTAVITTLTLGKSFVTLNQEEFSASVVIRFPERDLAVLSLPAQFPERKDISKFFVRREDMRSTFRGRLVLGLESAGSFIATPAPFQYSAKVYVNNKLTELDAFDIHNVLAYTGVRTEPGLCGAPAFLDINQGKILGMHVAGATDRGLISMFDLDTFGNDNFDSQLLSMIPLGVAPVSMYGSGRSKIVKGAMHGLLGEVKKRPSRLRPFKSTEGRIDPLAKRLGKYQNDLEELPFDMVEAAVKVVVGHVRANSQERHNVLEVSWHEAISGCPGEDYMDSLNFQSSPGYPFTLEHHEGFKGKQWWLGKDGLDVSTPQYVALEKELDADLAAIRRGDYFEHFFIDSLKDELVSKEKWEKGDTRIFCAVNMKFLIIFMKFYRRWMATLAHNRIRNCFAVGVNPYSGDWVELCQHLSLYSGASCIDADYGGFDTTQRAQILKAVELEVTKWVCAPGDELVHKFLWQGIHSSKHICGDTLYQWNGNNPSGNPITTQINCFVNLVYLNLCWIKAHDNAITSAYSFFANNRVIVLGDDHVINMSALSLEKFSGDALREYMNSIQLKYTAADKTEGPILPKTLAQCTFLKRSFRYEPCVDRIVAPLDLDSILGTLNWTKKGQFTYQIQCDKVDLALRELSLHGRETFEHYAAPLLEKSADCLSYRPDFVDWIDNLRLTCNMDYHW